MVNKVLNRGRKKAYIPKITKADGTELKDQETIAENLKNNNMLINTLILRPRTTHT